VEFLRRGGGSSDAPAAALPGSSEKYHSQDFEAACGPSVVRVRFRNERSGGAESIIR
jgi:hypothetical protein